MPLISDNELKRRLEAYNYPVPPITETTKKILLKKLTQLDKEASAGKRRAPSNLIDYSSAEEEASSTPSLRRRKGASCTYKTEPVRAKSHEVAGRRESTKTNGGHQNNSRLVQISDGEDDDEEDQSSSEDDDAEEDEDEDGGSEEIGLQTSLNSDLETTHTNGNSVNGGGRKTQRFASSTPNTPVRSTASYLNGSKPSPSPLPFPPNSPLRRAVAKSREFGSLGMFHSSDALKIFSKLSFLLGEALASLSSTVGSSNTAESVVTQAPKTTSETTTTDSSGRNVAAIGINNKVAAKRPTVNTFSVSVFIVALTVLFFGIIALKYFSLRPRMDIENRLIICRTDGQATDDCISPEFARKCVTLFSAIVPMVEEQSAFDKCFRNESSEGKGVSVAKILHALEDSPEWRSEPLREILSHLVQVVLNTKPQLDIGFDNSGEEMVLFHDNPQLDWTCWFNIKSRMAANLVYISMMVVASVAIVGLLLFGSFKLYKWRSDMVLREKQDIFELVEQVLSLLVKHHHHLTMQDGTPRSVANGSRASLPVSHIRDQLIPPADRKRKRRIWSKVVQYIHESESRVREDVQIIYGEEHKVWQWIPEINWNPISHPGPNPYVAPIHVMPSASTTNTTPTTSRMPTPSSSRWQGSAFSSLNRNVAVPTYAPSSCLKVRHMFDKSLMNQNSNGWVKQVSDEILQRCAGGGAICHIAVDRESTEGCVYIKAVSNDDAANVFKTLHGQWYRGNLVTAKYLRDERYFEKFPDAKNHTLPMRPNYFDALN